MYSFYLWCRLMKNEGGVYISQLSNHITLTEIEIREQIFSVDPGTVCPSKLNLSPSPEVYLKLTYCRFKGFRVTSGWTKPSTRLLYSIHLWWIGAYHGRPCTGWITVFLLL